MSPRIAGVAYLKVNADQTQNVSGPIRQLPLRGNFTVSPSTYEKAMLAGQDYVHGYSEVPRVPFIEGDVSLIPELSVVDVANMLNITVTAELANGRVYTLTEAVCTAAFELNARDGLMRVRFEGKWCDEFTGSTIPNPLLQANQTTTGQAP